MRNEAHRGRGRGRRVLAAACAAAGIAAFVAACGPGSANGGAAAGSGGTTTATYAMQPGATATYIFPFISAANAPQDTVFNVDDFQYMLYRPLYWFGTGIQPTMNTQLSLASPPVYQGNQVTITLKPTYKWSDGEPVDAEDVVFFMNMMIAENQLKNPFIANTPTGIPNDISNVRAASQYVVTMDITSPQFSETWFTDNELSQITPMPAAWDITGPGKTSDCVSVISDCNAVYNYLASQATNVTTYGTSPIWSVVDGPWKVQSLDTQGNLKLLYNDKYSGPVAAHHITEFVEVPFTDESAEYNVLQDPVGTQPIDVGYLPTVDAPVPPAGSNVGANPGTLSGYKLSVLYPWGLDYFPYNFNNNTGQGAIFDQLYFRTAFQDLVDQEGVISGPMHGYGKPDVGPVSTYPVTSFLSPKLAHGDPWTLNIPAAKAALLAHGWKQLGPGQPLTCVNAGSLPTQCGSGVPSGIQLKFTLMYATGIDYMESAARELASNALLADIQLTLDPESFSSVLNTAFASPPNTAWQLAEWGGFTFSPDYLPTGDTLFQGGSPNNAGGYNNPTNNADIVATLQARTPSEFTRAMYAWENYLSGQLPVVYTPNAPTLIETIKNLNIGPQNSALTITPEMWFYK
jgi:peptide/nickel transport system substrate-binding protein